MLFILISLFCDFTLTCQSVTWYPGRFEISREVNGQTVTLSATNQQWAQQFLQDWLRSKDGDITVEPDLYPDGKIDLLDFNEFARNYQRTLND